MHQYLNVDVMSLHDQQFKHENATINVLLKKEDNEEKKHAILVKDGSSTDLAITLDDTFETIRIGLSGVIISLPKQKYIAYLFKFSNQEDAASFNKFILSIKLGRGIDEDSACQFDERTEESSAVQYFQFYGYLSQQQNMMQDYVRTSTYQRAIHDNSIDFVGKVVLDVGAGSGILSFFAAQAGARKVYAVEASSMAQHAKTLVENNRLSHCIQVISGKIEEIKLPEQVDIIISEPMGYMLYNERMLETYLHAKKWLKPNGKMFPTTGDLYVTPFTDESLYMEQVGKANFWYQQSFYGVDLTTLRDLALDEYFKQPIVDNFDVRICLARPIRYSVNFLTANEEDLHEINIPLTFQMGTTAVVHGLAFWFDVSFNGTNSQVWLSTAPTQPLTHWYQVRCLFTRPLSVNQGMIVKGHALLISNRKQSYDVEIYLQIDGTTISAKNVLDLKNPYFRYPNQPVQVPPGQHHESPTEQYWNGLQSDQLAVNAGAMHSNATLFAQNCNINNNNMNATGIYDGNALSQMPANFSTDNIHQATSPFVSSNHSNKSTTVFPSTTAQMSNGFISFSNATDGNFFTQQSTMKK